MGTPSSPQGNWETDRLCVTGTITAYSASGYEIDPFYDNYESLPECEKWQAHRTLPAADFLNIWSAQYARLVNMLVPSIIGQPTTGTLHSRARNRLEIECLAQETGTFKEWHPDMRELTERIKDEGMKQHLAARWRHTAVSEIRASDHRFCILINASQAVYDCFLRHGWPDSFSKEACRLEMIELEKQTAVEEKAFCDANNPDTVLFDD